MSGTFNNHLYVFFPGSFRQFTQSYQLFDLGNIPGVRDTAWSAGVAQAQCHIIFPADFQDMVIVLIERIFLSGHFHPGKDNRAAPGNNIGKAFVFLETACGSFIDPHMDSHKVHPVLGVHFYDVDPFLGSDLF